MHALQSFSLPIKPETFCDYQEHFMRPNSYIMGHPIVPLMASLFQVPFRWKNTGTGMVCVIWLQIEGADINGVLLSSLCLQNNRRYFFFYMCTFHFFWLHVYLILQKVFLINLYIHMLKKNLSQLHVGREVYFNIWVRKHLNAIKPIFFKKEYKLYI